jgi:peptidoglycan/xylan/chitin deacetylase (PgdA/CDA1 family)
MKFYWIKTGWIINKLFSRFMWHIPNDENKIYLTFDDGPTPQITEWVLNQLNDYGVKATFFCIGNNIEKHPELFQKVIDAGHAIGNHTFNHLNGWNTNYHTYLTNIALCEESIAKRCSAFSNTKLFRPPYGKIKSAAVADVKKQGYKIIMWDVLSADFDQSITPQKCLENVIGNTREGSIIIFHDSVKAFPNLEYALPKALKYLKEKNFRFETLY